MPSRRSLQHSLHCNTTKDKDEKEKPASSSRLLPLGVEETMCGCIATMPRPCTRKKLGANLSDKEIEYVRITHVITME
eukprot:scaffold45282_cov66-Attheya_sp.AAC.3